MLMGEIYGTFEFKHFANKGKIEKIKTVLKEYRKTAQNIANYLWMEFFKSGGNLPHKKKISVKHIPSNLSERYKYVCLWQVHCVLQSYISNLQRQFADIVWNSTLSREDKNGSSAVQTRLISTTTESPKKLKLRTFTECLQRRFLNT